MEKSNIKAFTYMFRDNDWKYKLFVLSLLAVPSFFFGSQSENLKQFIKNGSQSSPQILVFLLWMLALTAICSVIFEGYCCKCTQKIIYSNETTPENDILPIWDDNFWEYAKIGITFSIGIFLLGLAVMLGSILIIPLIFYIVAYIALKTLFCVDFKMGEFFAWKKALKLMKNNPGQYLSVILYTIGTYIIFGFITLLCSKWIIAVFVGAFVQAYVFLVFAYLRGTLFPVNPEIFFQLD